MYIVFLQLPHLSLFLIILPSRLAIFYYSVELRLCWNGWIGRMFDIDMCITLRRFNVCLKYNSGCVRMRLHVCIRICVCSAIYAFCVCRKLFREKWIKWWIIYYAKYKMNIHKFYGYISVLCSAYYVAEHNLTLMSVISMACPCLFWLKNNSIKPLWIGKH